MEGNIPATGRVGLGKDKVVCEIKYADLLKKVNEMENLKI